MKSLKLLIVCLLLIPSIGVQGKENQWKASRDGNTYTLTPEVEHLAQDRSVTYLPELPFDIREVDNLSITLKVETNDSEWNESGIVFGGDGGTFHFFLINSFEHEKYFTYGRHIGRDLNQNWNDFIYRVKSEKIDNRVNIIRIQKKSKGLEFFINGKSVAQHELPELQGTKVGYYLRGGDVGFSIKGIEIRTK